MSAVQLVSVLFLALGGLVMLAGAIGVLRFPDFYSRLHAAGKGDTLGQALVILGLVIPVAAAGFGLIGFKLVLIAFFIFIFNPTATHALARGAWIIGLEPWSRPGHEGHGGHAHLHEDGPPDEAQAPDAPPAEEGGD